MKSAAIVTRVAGRAFAVRGGQDVPLQPGSELFVTDSIRTEGDSKLEMRFHDNSELDLGPLTHVNISDFAFDEAGVPPTFGVHVLQGLTRTATGKVVEQNPEGFSLTTPLGSAGIRGTVIWASVSEKQVIFTVTELGEGHTVVITTADGRTVIIHIPETGVIITEGDTSPLDVFEMTPEQLMEHLRTIFQEDIGATTPQGFYVWGDAEFIASLGNVGTAASLIPFGHAQTLVGSLQDMGVGKGAIETAIGIIADPPTVTPPVIPPPPALPPVTTNGTALPDTLVGVAGRDNIITGGAGNDFITTYDGTAVISGGYGSRDFIVKMGDITDGTEIFGDEKVMSGTADAVGNYLVSDKNDYILVRGEGNEPDSSAITGDFGVVTMSGGAIYGNGHTLTYVDTSSGTGGSDVVGQNGETTLPPEAGDTIRLIGFMTGGAIYGDAYSILGGQMPTGDDVISIEMGLDSQGNWAGGVMSGGVIYGDAYSVQTSTGTDLFYFGSDSISVGTLTGDGKIYGDAYEPIVSGTTYGGADSFYVGMMSGGAIYGDYHTISNGAISDGNDSFTISGMSGGTIYGDAHTLNVNHIDGCSDVITIDSDSTMGGMSGGTIYGDAYEMKMNAVGNDGYVNTTGNDILLGSMTGGAVYGNAHTIDLKGLQYLYGSFGDRITVRSTLSDASIFGDADTLSVAVGGNTNDTSGLGTSFRDEIVIDASVVNKATIYGDARVIDSLSFDITSNNSVQSFMSDKIEVGTVVSPATVTNNTFIYGDAEIINSVTFNTVGTPVLGFGGFMSDTITINGSVTNSIIYGDARTIEFMDWGNTNNGSMPFSPPSINVDWYADIANSAPLSDKITVTGTLGAGAIIYGDTESGTIANFSSKNQGSERGIDSIGHDLITVGALDGGKIHAGFGCDRVVVDYLKAGQVNLGTGQDTFVLNGFANGAVLDLDFGNDRVKDTLDLTDLEVSADGTRATINLYNFGANNVDDDITLKNGWVRSDTDNDQFTITHAATNTVITFNVMPEGNNLQI